MHMLRRQSRWTASKTTPHSESLRGTGQNQPSLMRSRLTTPALSFVLLSPPTLLPPLTQPIQATSNHVRSTLSHYSFIGCSASTPKSALDYPKHLAGWAHRGSENEDDYCDWDWWESGGSRAAPGGVWWQTRKRCLPVLLLWEHFPAPSSCSKHYLALPLAGHALMCQWPRKADNHWLAREWWAPTLPLQPINPTQTSVYPDR